MTDTSSTTPDNCRAMAIQITGALENAEASQTRLDEIKSFVVDDAVLSDKLKAVMTLSNVHKTAHYVVMEFSARVTIKKRYDTFIRNLTAKELTDADNFKILPLNNCEDVAFKVSDVSPLTLRLGNRGFSSGLDVPATSSMSVKAKSITKTGSKPKNADKKSTAVSKLNDPLLNMDETWQGYSISLSICAADTSYSKKPLPYDLAASVKTIYDMLDGMTTLQDFAILYRNKSTSQQIHVLIKTKNKSEPSKETWLEWAELLHKKIEVEDDEWRSFIVGTGHQESNWGEWDCRLISRTNPNSMMWPPVQMFEASVSMPLEALEQTAPNKDRIKLKDAFKEAYAVERAKEAVTIADVDKAASMNTQEDDQLLVLQKVVADQAVDKKRMADEMELMRSELEQIKRAKTNPDFLALKA